MICNKLVRIMSKQKSENQVSAMVTAKQRNVSVERRKKSEQFVFFFASVLLVIEYPREYL